MDRSNRTQKHLVGKAALWNDTFYWSTFNVLMLSKSSDFSLTQINVRGFSKYVPLASQTKIYRWTLQNQELLLRHIFLFPDKQKVNCGHMENWPFCYVFFILNFIRKYIGTLKFPFLWKYLFKTKYILFLETCKLKYFCFFLNLVFYQFVFLSLIIQTFIILYKIHLLETNILHYWNIEIKGFEPTN